MSDNQPPPLVSFELELEDIAPMIDLLQLGSCTALMYGRRGAAFRERLNALKKVLEGFNPLPDDRRGDGYSWYNAIVALRTHVGPARLEATWDRVFSRRDIKLHLGELVYTLADGITVEQWAACAERLEETLRRVAGLETTLTVAVQTISRW